MTRFGCLIAFVAFAIPAAASAATASCVEGPVAAAKKNAATLTTLSAAPFHRPEQGWKIYAPLVQNELGSKCGADTPAFAKSLSIWQHDHKLAATGAMDVATLDTMKAVWQARRPFVSSSHGGCPPTPPSQDLATVPANQSYGGKTIELAQRALLAYEKMATAARQSGVLTAGADLKVFSGYRSPQYDAARCAKEHNCQGIVRDSRWTSTLARRRASRWIPLPTRTGSI
jgi:hypothetical protein